VTLELYHAAAIELFRSGGAAAWPDVLPLTQR
jgi:hypothetical protein